MIFFVSCYDRSSKESNFFHCQRILLGETGVIWKPLKVDYLGYGPHHTRKVHLLGYRICSNKFTCSLKSGLRVLLYSKLLAMLAL